MNPLALDQPSTSADADDAFAGPIPKFHLQIPQTLVQEKLREASRSLALQRKSEKLITDAEFKVIKLLNV